jgi:hypothetical protein
VRGVPGRLDRDPAEVEIGGQRALALQAADGLQHQPE